MDATLKNLIARVYKNEALNLDTGARHTVYEGAWMARFAPPDHLLVQRRGSLIEIPFDAASATVKGRERLVREGVGGEPSSGAGFFSAGAARCSTSAG